MGIEFPEAVLLLGLLLGTVAALSGWLHGTVLSASVLSLGAGILLAFAGVIDIEPGAEIVVLAVELALLLTLFSDGLITEHELLRTHWGPPVRALVLAMPITLALLALAAQALFPLSWAEAFLLAAVLSPTDPVVTSSIVTAERVPPAVRHTLNLESGLNDGLALPLVLVLLALASPGSDDTGSEVMTQLGEVAAGVAFGAALGLVAGWLLPRLPGGGLTPRYEGIYALSIAFIAFGLSDITIGNGLIAAFVAGIVLGLAEHGVPDAFGEFNENVSTALQVVTFFLFGALVVETGYAGDVWVLALFIGFALLIARPVAILLAFSRVALPTASRLFVAWFGPKGVASMLFALFVLNSQAPDRSFVFDIAAFVVLASILAHGLTETVGQRWIEGAFRDDSG